MLNNMRGIYMNIEEFHNKKILIFCPHEDDEINIAGGLLLELRKLDCEVKVIYSTNGDWFINAEHRIKEARKCLKKLGVPESNVIFLGYPDCLFTNESHLYMANENWVSPKGIQKTYLPNEEEYHYKRHREHARLSRENFLSDIFEVIEEEMADILICIDYDEHCDHRALSLGFENAMGRILNEYKEYAPIVLKAFAYPTAYDGFADFKTHKLLKTRFKRNEVSLYNCYNPYYNWKNRVSIDVLPSVKNKFLLLNPLFIAMMKHISQPIYTDNIVYRIINRDQIFFRRRTDNLLYHSKVKVSSGDAKILKDFMLFDSSDIMNGVTKSEVIDLGYTKFNKLDNEKRIQVIFDEKVDIEEINIYQFVKCETKLQQIKLVVDNKEIVYNTKMKDYCYSLKKLKLTQVEKLDIIFECCAELELTELEVFSNSINCIEEKEEKEVESTLWDRIIFVADDVIIFAYRCIAKILRCLFY